MRTRHHLIVDLMHEGISLQDATDIAAECFDGLEAPADAVRRLEGAHKAAEEGVRIETRRTNALRAVLDKWRRDKQP